MNVNQKINFKENAYLFLEWNQYEQLLKRNLLCLAPYYNDRLMRQLKYVSDSNRFKTTFGSYRFEYENR